MTKLGLTRMTKVEVVVPTEVAAGVRDVIRSSGATGWTGLAGVSGFGHHGAHQGRLLFNDRAGLTMLITVVPEERLDPLLAGLRPLLESASGVMFVSDTYVSRPDYFR